MKNQERSDKIKKFLMTFLIIITSFNYVNAEEYPDVTDDIEIRYKWYKEVTSEDGGYYPLKEITENDKVDLTNIKYVLHDASSPNYCSLSPEYYLIHKEYIREYRKIQDASYVLIENISPDTDIQIYHNDEPINFRIMSTEDNQIKINLNKPYSCGKLLFYVDSNGKYKISLYTDLIFKKILLSKELENTKISITDETWITKKTKFYNYTTTIELVEDEFTKLQYEELTCKYSEKYVYKYEVIKEYYDDDYHLNVDGYIKDENDYRFFYKGEPIIITNTIEIVREQIIKEPQIEYVYIENEDNREKDDSSQETGCSIETKTEIKRQIIEKEIFKIPKKIYIIIFLLTVLVFLLVIKLIKKHVE